MSQPGASTTRMRFSHTRVIKADVRAKRTKKEPPKDHRRHTKREEIQLRDCQQKFRERQTEKCTRIGLLELDDG